MLLAAASGLLVGASFPPIDLPWLVWITLVPLLWAILRSESPREAAILGLVAGTVGGLVAIRPLVTAHSWTGWAVETTTQLASSAARQWWYLHGLWIAVALWAGGLFWALFAGGLRWLAGRNLRRFLFLAPPIFVVTAEWLRSLGTWGFHWALLGNAAAAFGPVRQLGALGGVWLLSALVVVVNVGLLGLLLRKTTPRPWAVPAAAVSVLGAALLGGWWHLEASGARPEHGGFPAAVVQHHQPEYRSRDYLPIGLDRNYWQLVRQIARGDAGEVDFLALPESVAFGSLSLDGSASSLRPPQVQWDLRRWTSAITAALDGSPLVVALGVETIERRRDYNSMLYWAADGPIAWYHKQKLVPFGEYQPRLLEALGLRGTSQFSPGRGSRIVRAKGVAYGTFICQEVLIPSVLRRSVLDGAEVLVSGGNDGVFASPAIAEVHADLARLRAAETGRYMVRAMKTGVSAIVAPNGDEIARSPSAAPILLRGKIAPLRHLTPYVRFGPWPLWASLVAILIGAARKLGWLGFGSLELEAGKAR